MDLLPPSELALVVMLNHRKGNMEAQQIWKTKLKGDIFSTVFPRLAKLECN